MPEEKQASCAFCPDCGHQFPYDIWHCGFGDDWYLYCNRCGMAALFNHWDNTVAEISKLHNIKGNQGLAPKSLEPFVLPCSCGGVFSLDASPRCPHCARELSAELMTIAIEKNAPGTAKGWRWDRNWKGIYVFVVDKRFVKKPLRDDALRVT